MPNGMPQQPPVAPNGGKPVEPEGGSPLDKFSKVDDTNSKPNGEDSDKPTDPEGTNNTPAKSVFDSTTGDYAKLVEQTDFVGEISEEVVTAMANGDMSGLKDIINGAARHAFASASFAASQVAKRGLTNQFEQFQSEQLPNVLNDYSHNQAFKQNKHEVLSHPSVAPLVEQQTNVFRSQFPNASPTEIQEKVTEYFTEVAKAFTGSQQQQEQTEADAGKTGLEDLFNF
jgi:hypothetical protein